MTRYLTILAMTTVVACGGKDNGGDTGGDGPAECANSVASQIPPLNSVDVYYKTDVRVTLQVEDPTAEIVVTDPDGAEVPGESEVVGKEVIWTTDNDFTPGATYTVTVNFECDPVSYTLTISDVGTPIGDLDLSDRVYSLDLTTGIWLEPKDVGSLLGSLLADTQIFVTPTDITGDKITMLGGIGSAGTQDLCTPTIDFPPATWADPFFQLTAPSLQLVVADIAVNIEDLDLSGAFAPDGGLIQGTSLRGTIDTRALVEVVEPGGEDNAVCVLVGALGVSCLDCTDGSGQFCLSVWVDNIAAEYLPDTTLVPRTDADIEADTVCTPPPA